MKNSFSKKGIFFIALLLIILTTGAFSFNVEHENEEEGPGMFVYELRMLDIQEETAGRLELDHVALGLPQEAPETYLIQMNALEELGISTERLSEVGVNTVNFSQFRNDFHPSVVTVLKEEANIKLFTDKIHNNTREESGFFFSVRPETFNHQNGADTALSLEGKGRLAINLDTNIKINVGEWLPVAVAVTTEKSKDTALLKSEKTKTTYRYSIVYLGMYLIDSNKDLGEIDILPFSNAGGIENDPFFNRDAPIRRENFARLCVSKNPSPTNYSLAGEGQFVVNENFYLNTDMAYSFSTGIERFGLEGGIMLDEGFAVKPAVNLAGTTTTSATQSVFITLGIEDVTAPSENLQYHAGIDFAGFEFGTAEFANGFFFPLAWELGMKWSTENAWHVQAQINGYADFEESIWDNLLPRAITASIGYSFYSPVLARAGVRFERASKEYFMIPFICAKMSF